MFGPSYVASANASANRTECIVQSVAKEGTPSAKLIMAHHPQQGLAALDAKINWPISQGRNNPLSIHHIYFKLCFHSPQHHTSPSSTTLSLPEGFLSHTNHTITTPQLTNVKLFNIVASISFPPKTTQSWQFNEQIGQRVRVPSHSQIFPY